MSKSRCCNEYAIKYSSIGIKGDVNTHYTCTYCGKISDKPKEEEGIYKIGEIEFEGLSVPVYHDKLNKN